MDNENRNSSRASTDAKSASHKSRRDFTPRLSIVLSICATVVLCVTIVSYLYFGQLYRSEANGASGQNVVPAETPTPPQAALITPDPSPAPEPTQDVVAPAPTSGLLTREQVETFIRPFLPVGTNIRNVKHLNEPNHNIAVEIYEWGIINISADIADAVDEIIWYDGVNNFSLGASTLQRDGNQFIVGDNLAEVRRITIWVIPEAVKRLQN